MLDERGPQIKRVSMKVQKVKGPGRRKLEEEFKKKMESASKEGQEVILKRCAQGRKPRKRAQEEAKQEAQALVEKSARGKFSGKGAKPLANCGRNLPT